MTNGLTVAPGERHVLRVFALDMPDEAAERLRDAPGRDRALGALLGVDRLDPGQVEILNTADLAGVGLAQYLTEGDGAVEAQVAADRGRLDALTGRSSPVRSGAFGEGGMQLHPGPQARLVGTYREDVQPVHFEPLPDAGARGTITPPPPSQPPKPPGSMGRGLYIALAVVVVVILLAVLTRLGG